MSQTSMRARFAGTFRAFDAGRSSTRAAGTYHALRQRPGCAFDEHMLFWMLEHDASRVATNASESASPRTRLVCDAAQESPECYARGKA